MAEIYEKDLSELQAELGSRDTGLSEEEAGERLQKYGKNELEKAGKKNIFQKFLDELKDPMLIMLLAAAVVSAVTNAVSGESMAEVFIILIVVGLNAALGVFQESKAENAVEALQKMTAATCHVIRDGKQEEIPSSSLVPGDVVLLEAGDMVPADGRLLEAESLRIDESSLTGESVPVQKLVKMLRQEEDGEVSLGDRKNMAFMGSSVSYGRGRLLVTDTGMRTEMGKIAGVLNQTEDSETPLQKKLNELGKKLSVMVIFICIFIFIFDMVMAPERNLSTVLQVFMIAVSLAVAAIPEGLATVVTLVLSLGVTRMSKANAIVRRLTAVEALGCTNVICSDKTGTLTQNRMTVVRTFGDRKLLAEAMSLCSDAQTDEDGAVQGEPTEAALVAFAEKEGFHKKQAEKTMPRIAECPFDSSRKMMTTFHHTEKGIVQYTKGAPDVVLGRCATWIKDGKELPLDEEGRRIIQDQVSAMAADALRVLAAARRSYETLPENHSPEQAERNLCFIGLAGMMDPVRKEVPDALRKCREAGIRPVMITGDHRDTAAAIARELGIIKDDSEVKTGAELDHISDEELYRDIDKYHVYARVKPEHKVRIVNAWRKRGAITAMTGDGVNDAPSVKSADIGIGMGITGTDVTKNAADLILTDDNYATIVRAVEEGRQIYDNIRKAIQFLLSTNISEVIIVFLFTLFRFNTFRPMHLLFTNLLTDCFPAMALGMESEEKDVMKRPPRKSDDSIFSGGMGRDIAYQGSLVAVLVLISYLFGSFAQLGEPGHSVTGLTMAFVTLNLCEIFHSFNMRSRIHSVFTIGSQNLTLWLSGISGFILTTLAVKIPAAAKVLQLEDLPWKLYGIAALIAFLVIPVVETVKAVQRALRGKKTTSA